MCSGVADPFPRIFEKSISIGIDCLWIMTPNTQASLNDLILNIRKFWQLKMNDLAYCSAKFNHLHKVVNQIITVCGRATGL